MLKIILPFLLFLLLLLLLLFSSSSPPQISIMRPPNYTLLMIWIPVIIIATVIGYLKRENLHMLYNTRYWAVAAMVRVCFDCRGDGGCVVDN